MTQDRHREAIVETLLNTLEAERYTRGPLLQTVADELSANGLAPAAELARNILARLDEGPMSPAEFGQAVQTLRRVASEPPAFAAA